MPINALILAEWKKIYAACREYGMPRPSITIERTAYIFDKSYQWARYHLNQMVGRGELLKGRQKPRGCIRRVSYILKDEAK